MIVKGDSVAFIDFGLSYQSTKVEDKAVDLHLFLQALESKHFDVKELAWASVLEGYRPSGREDILKRLEAVERRGRNKA
jgi:TP53 regulating kinase-like protein